MNGRLVGIVVIALSVGLFYALYISTTNALALNAELHKNCTLPEGICPYTRSIPAESVIGFGVDAGMIIVGAYLFFSYRESEKFSVSQKRSIKSATKSLAGDEQKIYKSLVESDGFAFQNELMEKNGLNKVKMTRVLDKLEAKNLVERRRRGMSNVVVLKHE